MLPPGSAPKHDRAARQAQNLLVHLQQSKLQLEAEKRKKMILEKHVYCKEKKLWRNRLTVQYKNKKLLSAFKQCLAILNEVLTKTC